MWQNLKSVAPCGTVALVAHDFYPIACKTHSFIIHGC